MTPVGTTSTYHHATVPLRDFAMFATLVTTSRMAWKVGRILNVE
jgi:hypothetical protein